jgi:hypothetical protein
VKIDGFPIWVVAWIESAAVRVEFVRKDELQFAPVLIRRLSVRRLRCVLVDDCQLPRRQIKSGGPDERALTCKVPAGDDRHLTSGIDATEIISSKSSKRMGSEISDDRETGTVPEC